MGPEGPHIILNLRKTEMQNKQTNQKQKPKTKTTKQLGEVGPFEPSHHPKPLKKQKDKRMRNIKNKNNKTKTTKQDNKNKRLKRNRNQDVKYFCSVTIHLPKKGRPAKMSFLQVFQEVCKACQTPSKRKHPKRRKWSSKRRIVNPFHWMCKNENAIFMVFPNVRKLKTKFSEPQNQKMTQRSPRNTLPGP